MKKVTAKIILIFSTLMIAGCAGSQPENLGVNDNRLAKCPDSPNCVSSHAADEKHFIDPITYSTSREKARETLIYILESWPGTSLIEKSSAYVYVSCRSKLFGFVDDVEFFFPETESLIHVRSASRMGYSDLGVNRKRIEAIRTAFEKAMVSGGVF